MTHRWGTAGATALATAIMLAGCEGGGVSQEEFVEEANAICEEHRAAIEEEASQLMAGGELPSPEEFGQLAHGTIIPELDEQFSRLGELEPPDELADDFEAYVSEGEEKIAEMEQDPSIITDPGNFQELNAQADEAGLSSACHVGPGEGA